MNFEDYFRYKALQEEIADHTQKGKDGLEALLLDFHNETERKQLFSLDNIHKALKHLRSCPDQEDDEEQCIGEDTLELINELIFERLTALDTLSSPEYTMAVCVCLLDLLKQEPVWDQDQSTLAVNATKQLLLKSNCIYVNRKALSINKRMVKMDIDSYLVKDIINTTCCFLQKCRQMMTQQDSKRITSEEYTEFFYTPFENITCDRECLKIGIQTIVDIFSYLVKTNQEKLVEKEPYWIDLIHTIQVLHRENQQNFIKLLFDTCCVGDDDTVQLLSAILEIYELFPLNSNNSSIKTLLELIDINPHALFLQFLYQCGNTHSIIVDLLLENDSNFLLFFYSYIKYALNGVQTLRANLFKMQEMNVDTLCTIFTNTLRVLKGDAFPYNTKPLVKRLEQLILDLK